MGTLEEKIDEMIERKKEVAEKVIGTGGASSTATTQPDLPEGPPEYDPNEEWPAG